MRKTGHRFDDTGSASGTPRTHAGEAPITLRSRAQRRMGGSMQRAGPWARVHPRSSVRFGSGDYDDGEPFIDADGNGRYDRHAAERFILRHPIIKTHRVLVDRQQAAVF